jgi:DNA-binding MarR family transcriptional regulator
MTDAADEAEREPHQYLGYLIRRAQQRHVAVWTEMVSTEISSVQYSILVVLDRDGEASQRELCDAVDLDRSTIADLVARMERRELVERRRDTADARRKTVTLTAHGRAEHERLRPRVEEVQRVLIGSMPAETERALRHGLRLVLDAGGGAPSS